MRWRRKRSLSGGRAVVADWMDVHVFAVERGGGDTWTVRFLYCVAGHRRGDADWRPPCVGRDDTLISVHKIYHSKMQYIGNMILW